VVIESDPCLDQLLALLRRAVTGIVNTTVVCSAPRGQVLLGIIARQAGKFLVVDGA